MCQETPTPGNLRAWRGQEVLAKREPRKAAVPTVKCRLTGRPG